VKCGLQYPTNTPYKIIISLRNCVLTLDFLANQYPNLTKVVLVAPQLDRHINDPIKDSEGSRTYRNR
jgi:hypothetical protein